MTLGVGVGNFGDMLDKIKGLQQAAEGLEPGPEARAGLLNCVNGYAEEFYTGLYERKAYTTRPCNAAGLLEYPLSEGPADLNDLIGLIRENVDEPGLVPSHRGHLGYIPGGGLYASALGDYLADVGNRYSGIFFAGPGAVRMENMMVRWMADLIGYPETAAGTLLSGGSIANLTAIVTARDAHGIKAADIPNTVIYLTKQVHHCVQKAIRIAGLSEAKLHYVEMDGRFRMDVNDLRSKIEADKAEGRQPWLVVASAGTTDTGAVDPADQIADVCEAHGLWLHIDAAYGGFFILAEEGREVIKGLERSDSIVMDPHKGLFLPYGTGAVIVKNRELLFNSHYYRANYMQDTFDANEELSPADLSPELTRHFRGLRMWLPLQLHGVAAFRAALSEKIWLARWFREQLIEDPNWEVGPEPDLSVVLYRYLPKSGDANEFNLKLIQKIHEDGRVFLSSTTVNGKVFLRLAVLCFRTHLDTVELALEMLRQAAAGISNDE